MRSTRQGPVGSEKGEAPTLQQLMEVVCALQESNEEYRHEQERIREEARTEQKR